MAERFQAQQDSGLRAQVVSARAMIYSEGASDAEDRPPHVRAASGLSAFKDYLAVVQDDANWLALVDRAEHVYALPLPPGPASGARVFSPTRGNKGEKFDLEACITLPAGGGHELIGFGSGSHRGREWLLRVHERENFEARLADRASHAQLGLDLRAEFLDAQPFYDSLRATPEFAGAGLNLEGAVLVDGDTIRLFQRGNAPPTADLPAIDATGDVSWQGLAAHLADPHRVPPPPVTNIRHYELGDLDGVRLTFSDAELLSGGRILYSASAENPETDAIHGSALGVLEADGRARWCPVEATDGSRFTGKIEGLSQDTQVAGRVRFVIDDDDETAPSEVFQAQLSDAFFRAV